MLSDNGAVRRVHQMHSWRSCVRLDFHDDGLLYKNSCKCFLTQVMMSYIVVQNFNLKYVLYMGKENKNIIR